MEDLSISIPDWKTLYPLGGGNPAHIPEIQALIREAAETLIADTALFAKTVGDYDSPQGNELLREVLATKLKADYGWAVTADHIVITNGSQASFEILFNSLAGQFDDGTWRQLLLPMTPEYVGYTDMARQDQPLLRAQRANIELIGDRQHVARFGSFVGCLCDQMGHALLVRRICSRATQETQFHRCDLAVRQQLAGQQGPAV